MREGGGGGGGVLCFFELACLALGFGLIIIRHPRCGVGLLDFKLDSGTLALALSTPRSSKPRLSLQCPKPESLVPSPRVSLECPTPECSCSAQPQSVPGMPNPRVSLPREGGDVRSQKMYYSPSGCGAVRF